MKRLTPVERAARPAQYILRSTWSQTPRWAKVLPGQVIWMTERTQATVLPTKADADIWADHLTQGNGHTRPRPVLA